MSPHRRARRARGFWHWLLAAAACGSLATCASPVPGSSGSSSTGDPALRRAIAVGVGTPPLKATLTLPVGSGRFPAVVLVGGSGPSDQDETVGPDKPFQDIADGLAARGIATLRYDKRTHDYPYSINQATFTATDEYVPDAVAALAVLQARAEIDSRRIFILGHSEGGTFAPLIAKAVPSVAGVVLMAASAEAPGPNLIRQVTYLASLPGEIGQAADAELPAVREAAAELDVRNLVTDSPTARLSPLLGGTEPAYWLDRLHYDEVATARAIPQPLLFLQGDRDYNVTVADDLNVWLAGLEGRPHVTVFEYPPADHLFIDGAGPASPADYDHAAHVDPSVIRDIAAWVKSV